MAFAQGSVVTGARAVFKLNGTKVMYATNVTYSEEVEHQPVEVLDQFEVAENVPIAYRVTLSAQFVRIALNPIKNLDGVSVFPKLENILDYQEMTGTVEDKKGAILATIQNVRASRYNQAVQARGHVLQDVEFVAIRIIDESEVA